MKTSLRHIALAAGLAMSSAQAMAFGSILVSEPGIDLFNIETMAFNGSSFDIFSLTFDFTGTTTTDSSYLVIDGTPLSITPPAGGTATFFGSGAVFGFNFTSFNTFESFKFKWDPDSAISGAYGATANDFVGGIVTASTSNGLYKGTFVKVLGSPDVSAVLSPVPEPQTYALALTGLAVAGFLARRNRRA